MVSCVHSNVTQLNMHMEILHQIIHIAKTGLSSPLPRVFKDIILIGHSYGSGVDIALAAKYADDITTLVITGFAIGSNPPVAEQFTWEFAAAFSSRYAGIPLGYMVSNNESLRQKAFYSEAVDPAIPLLDYAEMDSVTVGEFGTLTAPTVPGFTKPLLMVTGADDQLNCAVAQSNYSSCEEIIHATVAHYFPNTTSYQYYVPPATGHCFSLHYTAKETFRIVHGILDSISEGRR